VANSSIVVVARLVAKPGKFEELRLACDAMVEPSRAERGCLKYVLRQNKIDQRIFTFIELWESALALNRHSQASHMAHFIGQLAELLAFPVVVNQYDKAR
jgi:quinol monooxygenase YgiN